MVQCESVVVAQELQTLLWAWLSLSPSHQNDGFSHHPGLFFWMFGLCFPSGSHPGWAMGVYSVFLPGCDYWALLLQNKDGGSQLSVWVHAEVFSGWRSWLCSLYLWCLHWVVWKGCIQLLLGRSRTQYVNSLILVSDLTSAQEWSDCTFLTLDICLIWLVTACASLL